MIGIQEDRVAGTVGDEGVVAEGREQRRLGTGELGPPDDQAMALVVGLGHPGLPVRRVVDRRPDALVDLLMAALTEGFCGAVIE